MVDAPSQGKWPIEPTTQYVFNYYPTTESNQAPTYNSGLLNDYNAAVEAAKEYITSEGNTGVCIILPVTGAIVYPFIPWEAF